MTSPALKALAEKLAEKHSEKYPDDISNLSWEEIQEAYLSGFEKGLEVGEIIGRIAALKPHLDLRGVIGIDMRRAESALAELMKEGE